ncbi:amino acid deaminase/aldolase [Corynebacterium zhongnanshanii]|uniref:Amino acid deaminase/aldolase n=1 Tax=Corynebacterium zhongnanshanii TaxID=2768834 RepID=A0ABQ6VD13_9CORY|nr:amino acid deaminase/aldolase [Corynebacterium zhongnanshanii]KAB3520800.1 amino acid deaminase/aldolase [Corynebacterium zhongnanshanii]
MKAEVRQAVAHLEAPFSVLDLDAAVANAVDMTVRAQGTPIRLASKSIRIPELMKRILELDGFHGILAYNLNEAIWLVREHECSDIVVAYPTANKDALKELNACDTLRAQITLMVDSAEHLDFIDEHVPGHEELRVCLDVDASLEFGPVHIGALRSPVRTPQDAATITRDIVRRPGFTLVGVMAYEGQIAGTTDSSPAIAVMKSLSTRELAARRSKVVQAVTDIAGPLEFVNGGGTGSIETTSQEKVITEIGAGSGVIGPALFDHYRTFTPEPAEWFVLPVVRRPSPQTVTIAGGGRVASGAMGKDRLPVVDWPSGLQMSPLEGPGEVQTPLTGSSARNLRLGDHVWFRHAKAGEQCEFAESVVVVSEGQIYDEWLTYRGAGFSFT